MSDEFRTMKPVPRVKIEIQKAIMDKGEIDRVNRRGGTNMVSYDRWLINAVELLLRIELERK